ncbi:hypothetical protein Tco_0929791 [Tanacetum coccineum]
MELYMQNREHGRMILELVEHHPLIWITIEENDVAKTKKYEELSATEKIQANCDLKIDSGLAVPVFKQGDDSIDAINIMMSLVYGGDCYGLGETSFITAGTFGTGLTSWNIEGINSKSTKDSEVFNSMDGHMPRTVVKPSGNRMLHRFRDKVLLVEAQRSSKVLNEEELEFLADLGVAEAKAVLMSNLSSYRSDVLSEVPHSENTNNDMLNQSVQEMSYSEQTHLDTNSSAQQDALILSVFEQLSNQVTNYNKVNNDNLIANETLSAKLERYKERVKLLEERQNMDLALGFQNPFYLKKAQQIRPMLYDGNVIAKETNVISIADFEETLMLEEESRSKMLLKQSDPMVLENKVNTKPIKYAELNRLSKDFDIVNIIVNSSVDVNTSVKVNSSVVMNDYVNYVKMCNKCLELEAELIKQHNMVEKDEYNRLSKRFSKLEHHCISLEIAMQLNKEIFQKNNIYVNQTEPSFNQLFELNNFKAEL